LCLELLADTVSIEVVSNNFSTMSVNTGIKSVSKKPKDTSSSKKLKIRNTKTTVCSTTRDNAKNQNEKADKII
jgi:hypothetical protein